MGLRFVPSRCAYTIRFVKRLHRCFQLLVGCELLTRTAALLSVAQWHIAPPAATPFRIRSNIWVALRFGWTFLRALLQHCTNSALSILLITNSEFVFLRHIDCFAKSTSFKCFSFRWFDLISVVNGKAQHSKINWLLLLIYVRTKPTHIAIRKAHQIYK